MLSISGVINYDRANIAKLSRLSKVASKTLTLEIGDATTAKAVCTIMFDKEVRNSSDGNSAFMD